MRRGLWLSVCIGAALGLAGSASAQTPAPPPAAPVAQAACARETSALGGLSCALGSALAEPAAGALVVTGVAPGAARLPEPLRQSAADLIASRLGPAASSVHDPLTVPEAQKRAGRRRLVYVTFTLARDHLEASADVYERRGRFWQRLAEAGPRVVAHAFESRPLDPELRRLFPAIPLVITRVDKARTADRDAVALACGDLDGDGSNELVLVTRRRIATGRLDHGNFATLAQAAWNDLSKVAASPPREPIASAWLAAPGRLRVGLSDRADGLELGAGLAISKRYHGYLPWGHGCALRGELALKGALVPCAGEGKTPPIDFAGDVDTIAFGPAFYAARPVNSSVAKLWAGRGLIDVPDAGAKIVVDDLDGDGNPEIVTTSPSLERKDDALVVRTLDPSGALIPRWRLPVPSGIDALTACPGDGSAMAPIALATGDALWVVR